MKVKACPDCGVEVQYHCFHAGVEMSSVVMDIEKARSLAWEHLCYLQTEVGEFQYILKALYTTKGIEEDTDD